jgi:hypothetical protein
MMAELLIVLLHLTLSLKHSNRVCVQYTHVPACSFAVVAAVNNAHTCSCVIHRGHLVISLPKRHTCFALLTLPSSSGALHPEVF